MDITSTNISMHTFLYARVSTTEETISYQQAQAEAAGYKFDEVIEDAGVSGVTTKFRDRKGGAILFEKLRRGDILVVRWVDRLGRNYEDVAETIRTLVQKGVVVKTIINGMTFDGATKDPIQKAVRGRYQGRQGGRGLGDAAQGPQAHLQRRAAAPDNPTAVDRVHAVRHRCRGRHPAGHGLPHQAGPGQGRGAAAGLGGLATALRGLRQHTSVSCCGGDVPARSGPVSTPTLPL